MGDAAVGPASGALLGHAVAVAERQSFGSRFDVTRDDVTLCDDLERGVLLLPPHPQGTVALPVDWAADPFDQRNWCFQLHSLRWLDPLRRRAAAGETGRMRLWDAIVLDWHRANSPRSDVRWAWNDMGTALRAQTLLFGLPHTSNPQLVLAMLDEHGTWLTHEENLGHSNHALHQHTALFMVGAALRRPDWRDLAIARIRDHYLHEYDDEGLNAEGAPAYWLLNLSWTRQLKRRMELEGSDTGFLDELISRAVETVAHATRPDGLLETLGDTGPERFTDRSTETSTYVATAGQAGSAPQALTRVFRGGYAFGRSGWGETRRAFADETFYSLVFGAPRVHGHPDAGSVTFAPGGRALLVDSGKYAYRRHVMRDYVLSRAGHNVVVVRGVPRDVSQAVDLIEHVVDEGFDYYRLEDRGHVGILLTREVFFAREQAALIVIDTVRSDREVEVEQRWHLPSGSEPRVERRHVAVDLGRATHGLTWLGSAPQLSVATGSESPFEGWVSPSWGVAEPAPVVKAVRSGTRFRFVTVVGPEHGRVSSESTDNGLEIRIAAGARPYAVLAGRSSMTPRGRSSRARIATVGGVLEEERLVTAVRRAVPQGRAAFDEALERAEAEIVGADHGLASAVRDAEATFGESTGRELDARTRRGFALVDGMRTLGDEHVMWFPSIPQDIPRLDGPTVLLVEAGPVLVQARYVPGEGALVVVLGGALDRESTVLPRFERGESLRTLGRPMLVFSDSTLDLDAGLRLGWYLGSAGTDLAEHCAALVEVVRRSQRTGRPVVAGSSGGGFAALQVAARAEGSIAVVFSPQIRIGRYFPRFAAAVAELFAGKDAVPERVLTGPRFNADERLASVRSGATRVVYFQNHGDGHHRLHHQTPFVDAMREHRPELVVDLRVVDWGKGHVSPSPECFRDSVAEHLGAAETTV